MISESKPSIDRSYDWVTAKLTTPYNVRPIVYRIELLGVDYRIEQVDHKVRVQVRARDLEEVLDWIAVHDQSESSAKQESDRDVRHRTTVALLIGILAGALFGSLFCYWINMNPAIANIFTSFTAAIGGAFSCLIFAQPQRAVRPRRTSR